MDTMRLRYRRSAGAFALAALSLLGVGCSRTDDKAAGSRFNDTPTYTAFSSAVTRSGAIYDIYRVTPNQGPLGGGTQVRLDGVFPDPALAAGGLAEIASLYTVYFGANVAAYDYTRPPTIGNAIINVVAPAGSAPGLVDVILRENANQLDAATLYYGYEYLDPFAITAVDPNAGPLAGGQQVTVYGRFPILAPITTTAAADATYQVYFDGRPASFDPSYNPVITADAMYVITPPGVPPNAPGLVDVSVATVVYSPNSPEFRVLPQSYQYLGALALYDVVPPLGWIMGDEPVTLEGSFPVTAAASTYMLASQASQYYTVYFDNRIAPFDTTVVGPVVTANKMYVRTPATDAPGLVDVRVEDAINPVVFSQLDQAFRYYALYITDVDPNIGPCAGGIGVTIRGLIPAFDSIYSVYEASAAYTVYFDGVVAPFADNGGNPIILPSQIDTINRTYTTGYMYVIAPPHAAGFVDVKIVDNLGIDLPATAPNAYEYNCGDSIARWDTAEVFPNPVGMLEKGELLVRVTGRGQIPDLNTNPVFIVPQGGDPSRSADRIKLDLLTYSDAGGTFTWEGTNSEDIPRVLNGHLVDGHAAIYIRSDNGILGDDINDLTEGGIIQPSAAEGRHFLIDTVPPRLQVNQNTGHLRGDDFVNPAMVGNWTVADLDTGTRPVSQTNPHPYPLPGVANAVYDAPFDGHWMYRAAGANSYAQVFFNVSSLTNNFADSMPDANGNPTANLQFSLDVVFEDVDVYTAMNMDQTAIDAGRNADYFTGSTVRQVAGFTDGTIAAPVGTLRDNALVTGNDVLIQWDFQSTPFRLPEFSGVTVQYSAGGPLAIGSNPGLSANLAAAPTLLFGTFNIGDASDATTGVHLADAGPRTAMSVIFRAVDRAGDYTPRANVRPGTKKLYTRNDTRAITAGGYASSQQPEMGPLNLWWMRTTGTRLLSNIPSSGDTRSAAFTWANTGEPDPEARPDTMDGDGAERVYSYAIFRTSTAIGTRDEQRDGPYGDIVGSLSDANGNGGPNQWSGWANRTSLSADEVQQIIAADGGPTEGVWFLLAVMSCDEAGNLELWPEQQLIGATATSITSVAEPGNEERNWDRWFVPPLTEAVDTRIEPFYWHDTGGAPFNRTFDNEPSFGDAEVIPYPPANMFSPLPDEATGIFLQRVSAQFVIRMISANAATNAEYELIENGQSVLTGTVAPTATGGDTASLVVPLDPDTGYLGSANRQPTYYVFRARTFIDANNNGVLDSGEVYDGSPAVVQFVVVENVANYIQNRKSEDTQPIQEMDRP